MKVIIPLAGLGTRMRPHTWSRPKPLLNVAGNTIIGYLLYLMSEITTAEVIFVVGYKADEIEAWIRQHYPHLDAHFVIQEEALGQAHAIWLCRDFLDEGDVLIAFGDGIVRANYLQIADADVDAVCLVQEVADPRTFGVGVINEAGRITNFIEKPNTREHRQAIAGIYWFRDGRQLQQALDIVIREDRRTKGEYYIIDAFHVLLEQGAKIAAKPTLFWFDAGKPGNLLETNAHLLSIGFGSEDAVERSYVEDFTVLPPVFIHESAVIQGAVLGPHTTIEAGVTVKNSIIRNSIIDAGATIENAILDGALIGENAKVTGRPKALFVGDDAKVEV